MNSESHALTPAAAAPTRPAMIGSDQWDDSASTLRHYFGILAKHRLLIAGTTIAAVLLAFALTLLTEPVYEARTTFEVQRELPRVLDNMNGNDVQPGGSSDQAFLQTQFAFIKSRSLATGVVRRLKLDNDDRFMGDAPAVDPGAAPQAVAASRQRRLDAAISKVQANIEAAPYAESTIIELLFKSDDPRLAASVANAAVDEFVESTIQRQFAASSYARSFVGGRLNQLKARLEASERELVTYAGANGILTVSDARSGGAGSQSLDSASLAALNDRLAQARASRVLAEETWNLARSGRGGTLPEIRDNPQVAALRQQLATLQADYQQKRAIFKPEFATMQQLASQIASVRAQLGTQTGQNVDGFRAQYQLALQQERALEGQLRGLKASVFDLQNRGIRYAILQREVDTNRALYDALLQRFKEIGIAGGSGANSVSIVDRARAPARPSSPVLWLNLLLALGAGVALGMAIALIVELSDDTIKLPEDVERKLGLPLLGVTPAVEGDVDDLLTDKRSPLAEAYHSVQTALQLATAGGLPRTLLVTSTVMAEGKSTSAMALAQGLADRGRNVLLVDADLRRPTLHRRIATGNTIGFSTLLTGEAQVSAAAKRVEALGFDVIPSGPLPPNPAQLLSMGLGRCLDAMKGSYDIVILDGPPILGLADAPLLADAAEATVLVIETRRGRRGAIRNALRRLSDARGLLVGVVMTKFSSRTAGYGYGYEYANSYYSYGNKPAKG